MISQHGRPGEKNFVCSINYKVNSTQGFSGEPLAHGLRRHSTAKLTWFPIDSRQAGRWGQRPSMGQKQFLFAAFETIIIARRGRSTRLLVPSGWFALCIITALDHNGFFGTTTISSKRTIGRKNSTGSNP